MPRPLLICLMGPTASGKTDLAVALAGARDCELISVDSALVYRGMDIGTAKPHYPHHLLDIRDPSQPYSAAEFATDAGRIAAEICGRGRTPVLVGGTMLYFRAFLHGLSDMPGANAAVRADIERDAQRHGWPAIHRRLAAVDPESAAAIHPNHSQRLTRALEVYRVSGVGMSEWRRRGPAAAPASDRYRVLQFAICPREREELHRRIEQRFQGMMAAGLLQEVRRLWLRGDLHPDLPAMRAVGYRQLWHYLDGDIGLDEAVKRGIAATRQLAKRQLTWLRKWPELRWIYTDSAGNVANTPVEAQPQKIAKSPLQVVLNYLVPDPMV